jgi:hypothetical protein
MPLEEIGVGERSAENARAMLESLAEEGDKHISSFMIAALH